MNSALKYWPLIVGLCSVLVIGAQFAFQLGSATSGSVEAHTRADDEIEELHDKIDRHADKAAHETTAIRLERIEVQQTAIARDVERINGTLETIAEDLKHATRRPNATP